LRLAQDISHLNPWNTPYGKLKQALVSAETVEVPLMDRWRLPYLCTLLAQRREAHNLVQEEEEERLEELINSLVYN
jgi:hypothetical protein